MFRPLLFLSLATALLTSCAPREEGPATPNIVLIMADDLGYSDLGCYGSEIRTPNLDALAARGIRSSRFYNAARCCPTRASLLTGLYPHEAGMGGMVVGLGDSRPDGPYQGYLEPDSTITLAESLKPAGYRTYMSGKWHVGEDPSYWPLTRGFDRYFGLISGGSSYFRLIEDQPRVRLMALDSTRWTPPDTGFYMTDAITDFAVERVREHGQQTPEQPFFLYLAYTAPHWPLHALPEDIARYEGVYDVGWDSIRAQRHRRQRDLGLFARDYPPSPRPDAIPAWEAADEQATWSRRMTVHAAMVDRMDQGIGQLLDALREQGMYENTLVMFLSDNGASPENISGRELNDPDVPIGLKYSYAAFRMPWANAANTPLRYYKAWTHEGGAATPFIAQWPKGDLPAGSIVRQPGHIIDIMPTLLAVAGQPIPNARDGQPLKSFEGLNLVPAWRGEALPARTLYWEHFNRAAVLDEPWKLVKDRDLPWELYRMDQDRTEQNNLADEQPERVNAMLAKYEDWAERVGVR